MIYASPANLSTEIQTNTYEIKLTGTALVTPPPSQGANLNLYPGPNTYQKQFPTSGQTTSEAYPSISSISTSVPTSSSPDENLLSPTAENFLISPSLLPTVTETLSTQTPIIYTKMVASNPATVKLASGTPQFIELFAFWCPICRSMAPVVNVLEQKYSGRVRFIYLDIDNPANDVIKQTLGFKSPPQFFLIGGQGNVLNQWEGYVIEADLEAALFAMQ